MEKKSYKKLWVILSAVLAILLIVALTVGATTAWFGLNRNITGRVELTPGIKVDFNDTILIETNNGINEYWLKKYDVSDVLELTTETTKSKLEIAEARPGDKYAVVNPKFTSLTSDNFYVRAKIIYKDIVTGQELTNDQKMEIFGELSPIKMGKNWLADQEGNWNYWVKPGTNVWQNNVANEGDLKLVEQDNEVEFLLTTELNSVNYVPLTLAPGAIVEHLSFDGFYIVLKLQAVEQNSVNSEFFA